MIEIGYNIQKIREMKNLSHEYIAEQLGLSLTSYGKIERGETDITYTRILRIAKLLDVYGVPH